MNKFLAKLERKWGRYAIKNLPMWMIIFYTIGYLIQYTMKDLYIYMTLDVYQILHGQVWRVVTWLLIPPPTLQPLLAALMMFVYFSIASTLEQVWGTFFLNLYIFSGIVLTIIGSFGIYLISHLVYGEFATIYLSALISTIISTYYINMSLFLGYAATFPEMEMRLMFLLPIKAKWLGLVYALLLADDAYKLFRAHWSFGMVIVISLLNFLIFFLSTRKSLHLNREQRQIRKNFRQQTRQASFGNRMGSTQRNSSQASSMKPQSATRHKCAVCGQTESTAPDLSFRFCTKCEGSYEYCENHIFTHQHVKKN